MESMGQKGAEVANRPPNFVPVFRSFLLLGKRERYAKDMWNDVRSILQHVTRSPAGAMCLLNASRGKAVLPRHFRQAFCVSAPFVWGQKSQCRIQRTVWISTEKLPRAPRAKLARIQFLFVGAIEAKNGSPQTRQTWAHLIRMKLLILLLNYSPDLKTLKPACKSSRTCQWWFRHFPYRHSHFWPLTWRCGPWK